jgi:NAD(P)-dependent dehydrogenase (short-subunit alcohol dehydrogenase family)
VTGPLDGRVAVVAVGGVGVGRAVADALTAAGAKVATIGTVAQGEPAVTTTANPSSADVSVDLDDAAKVVAAMGGVVAELGPIDISVFASIDPALLVPRSVKDLSEDEWDQLAEAPVRSMIWWLQASHKHFRDGRGRMITVCPTVAIEGAIGLAAAAAAFEGQRGLVKSAARRWATQGITCTMVAPAVWALNSELADTDAMRNVPVLPLPDNPLSDTSDTVVLLATDYAHRLTGVTVIADAGALMSP